MVWWKGIIVMILGKNVFAQVIAAIDLKVLKVKGLVLYILLWVLDFYGFLIYNFMKFNPMMRG